MIARVRKRPRVSSIGWKTFGWVLVHEAAVNVLVTTYGVKHGPGLRQWVCDQTTTCLRRRIDRVLLEDLGRRWWP